MEYFLPNLNPRTAQNISAGLHQKFNQKLTKLSPAPKNQSKFKRKELRMRLAKILTVIVATPFLLLVDLYLVFRETITHEFVGPFGLYTPRVWYFAVRKTESFFPKW